MALTARARLEAMFLGMRFLVVYFVNHFTILHCIASLQSQDKTPGEEGTHQMALRVQGSNHATYIMAQYRSIRVNRGR